MRPAIQFELPAARDIGLFLLFYLVSTLTYYITTWMGWGGFSEGGHPNLLHVEEFFASAGVNFMVLFLLSIPLWFFIFRVLRPTRLRSVIGLHLLFLPLFVYLSDIIQLSILDSFGWVKYFGGYNSVWNLYFTGLFYVVQFGMMHAYTNHYRYQQELERQAALREAVLKSELTALKAQLNPHFLNNVFNSISASIPHEQEHTRELIIQLADLFRYQNKATKAEWVPLKEEIQFIKNYLDLEKIRFKERLQVKFEIDQEALDRDIPPMLLQPLVENAITHGIAPSIKGGCIEIKVRMQQNRLVFSIHDTGVGVPDKANLLGKGIGLTNTKLRLEKQFASQLLIKDNKPSGLAISFTI